MFTFKWHSHEPIRVSINYAQYVSVSLYRFRKHAKITGKLFPKVGVPALRAFGKGLLSHTASLAGWAGERVMMYHGIRIGMREVDRAISQLIQSTLAAMAETRVKELGVGGLNSCKCKQFIARPSRGKLVFISSSFISKVIDSFESGRDAAVFPQSSNTQKIARKVRMIYNIM